MNQMKTFSKTILSEVEKILNRGLDNVYLNTAIKVFLVLYAALAAPQFPPKLVFLMDNVFVRMGIAFLIVFMALKDPSMALIIAVVFIITLQTANKLRLINTDLSAASEGETSWLPSARLEGFEDTVSGADDVADDVMDDVADDAVEKNSQSECERCSELLKNNTCRIVD